MRHVGTATLMIALATAVAVPCHRLAAQVFDSTGMPSLELLAVEAGRASRAHPIRAVAHALLCEPTHPLLDSASLAACAALPAERAAAITAAFARGIEAPLDQQTDSDRAVAFASCPTDLERPGAPRVLLTRISAPVVGVYEGHWEGRLLVEVRCRSPGGTGGNDVRILAKEYLYQWTGHAWKMYQHSWLRAGR